MVAVLAIASAVFLLFLQKSIINYYERQICL